MIEVIVDRNRLVGQGIPADENYLVVHQFFREGRCIFHVWIEPIENVRDVDLEYRIYQHLGENAEKLQKLAEALLSTKYLKWSRYSIHEDQLPALVARVFGCHRRIRENRNLADFDSAIVYAPASDRIFGTIAKIARIRRRNIRRPGSSNDPSGSAAPSGSGTSTSSSGQPPGRTLLGFRQIAIR